MIEDVHKQYDRRYRILRLSPESLLGLFTPGIFVECLSGVPPKSRVRNIQVCDRTQDILICFENNEFETVPDNFEIPRHPHAVFKSYWGKELGVMRRIIQSVKDKTGIQK